MGVSQFGRKPGYQPRQVFEHERPHRVGQHIKQGKANFDGLNAGLRPGGLAVHEGQFCQLRFVEWAVAALAPIPLQNP